MAVARLREHRTGYFLHWGPVKSQEEPVLGSVFPRLLLMIFWGPHGGAWSSPIDLALCENSKLILCLPMRLCEALLQYPNYWVFL